MKSSEIETINKELEKGGYTYDYKGNVLIQNQNISEHLPQDFKFRYKFKKGRRKVKNSVAAMDLKTKKKKSLQTVFEEGKQTGNCLGEVMGDIQVHWQAITRSQSNQWRVNQRQASNTQQAACLSSQSQTNTASRSKKTTSLRHRRGNWRMSSTRCPLTTTSGKSMYASFLMINSLMGTSFLTWFIQKLYKCLTSKKLKQRVTCLKRMERRLSSCFPSHLL